MLTRQYTWLNNPDAANLLLPWFQLQAAELHRFSLTLWDPYQWCGQPLIGQGQAGTAYPFNWLLWMMPLSHGWLRHVVLNWYFVLIHFQAALFTYWLCRDLGRSMLASLFAGLAFSVGPLLGVSDWPSTLNAAAWAPLILLFLFRVLRGSKQSRNSAFAGAALGMCWLSGSDQIPLLLSLACAGGWITLTYSTRHWQLPLMFGATAFGVAALQALPTLEYLAYSPDIWWQFPIGAWNAHSVSPMAIPGIVAPQFNTEAMIFAGWTLLAFAAIGFWNESRSREVRLLAAIAVAGLLLSFGRYVVFEGVLFGLRGLARDPKAALLLFGLGASTLSAYGIDACRRMEPAIAISAHVAAKLLAGVSALCWIALLLLAMTNGEDLKKFSALALCAIAAILVAALLEGWRRGAISPQSGAVCAILLAMWEFGNVAGSTWTNVEFGWGWLTQLSNASDAVQFLRSQPGPVRVGTTGALYNFGDWNGVEQFDGLSGGTENLIRVAPYRSAHDLTGTNFSVGTKPAFPDEKQVFDSPRGVKVFSNPDVAPRAFVVHSVTSVHTSGEFHFLLSKPASELRTHAFVTGPAPKIDHCEGADPASILWRKGRSVRVKASLTCSGLLVLGETWYPGWTVSIDGKPGALYQAYGFLQSTVVPAGLHEVTFTYKPRMVWIGSAITFLSLFGIGVLALRKPAG